jgi:transcriptional regulator with XRE-family HTH domain
MLSAAGILVHYLAKIHEKLAIIDDQILWSGCLNILSYNDTHEEMTRYHSRVRVKDAIARHKLERHASRNGRAPEWSLSHQRDDREARKHFGAYIIGRRQEMHISQRQLSSLADVGQSTLSQIESGAIDARLATIARICRALDCAVRPVPSFLVPSVASALYSNEAGTTERNTIPQRSESSRK